MPDLLSHVLVAYAVCRLASERYRWLTTRYVTVGMAGALLPDVSKVALVRSSEAVATALGVPFDWYAIHTLGGVALLAALGAVWVAPPHRRRVFALLLVGAATHLFLDGLLLKPTGHSYPALWPLTRAHLPTPGLYRSTDVWPTLVSLVTAGGVWVHWRWSLGGGDRPAEDGADAGRSPDSTDAERGRRHRHGRQ